MIKKFKCLLKSIYRKKAKYAGLMAAFLYLIDELFNLTQKCNLSPGWYYIVITVLFVLIGYAIHANDPNDDTNILEDIVEEKNELYGSNPDQPLNINPEEKKKVDDESEDLDCEE